MSRLEAVLATIGEQADRAERQIDNAERLARESEQLRVTGSSTDGLVDVVVDGVGQMVDVVFDREFDSADAARLSADVLEALAQAKRRLSAEVTRLGEEIYGEGSPTVQTISQSYRDRFGYEEDDR